MSLAFYSCLNQILKLVNRSFSFQLGILHDQSIGRLSANTEFYLRKNKSKNNNHLFLSSETPANTFLLQLIKRKITVITSNELVKIARTLKVKFPGESYWINLDSGGYYLWDEWLNEKPQLELNQDEMNQGKLFLEKLGLKSTDKFVCFHSRSKYYKDNKHLPSDPWWVENDFRTCDIESYKKAIDYLTDQGYYVFRMGRNDYDTPVPWNNPKVIDFAIDYYDDFLEIFLMRNCFFFLGNTAGIYLFASIFDRPIAYANMVPLGECGRKPTDLFTLKKYYNHTTETYIPFSEIINNYGDLDKFTKEQLLGFKKQEIEIIENSQDEILELAKEMESRLLGKFTPPTEYEKISQDLKNLFPPNHFMRTFPSPICAHFIVSVKEMVK